ncbi:MAG: sulfite exporter TauE/SafE family protein [Lutibacter sp.]
MGDFISIFLNNIEFIILFFFIAVLYSSVGFGGGSSYLAVLALSSLAFTQIRAIALICNIVVVSGSTYLYIKNNLFDWKKIVPLVIISVPMAFIGGYLKINQTFFYILLGFTLIIASSLMWFSKHLQNTKSKVSVKNSLLKNLSFGGSIGFISGMVGIGGGIFLSPLLHLTNWNSVKKIAATSSFFILVNSISGLAGQYLNPDFSIKPIETVLFMIVVFIGGQIGSRLSIKFISPIKLKKATAILIAFVGLRLLLKHLLV